MDESEHRERTPAPLGRIEPHAPLLNVPDDRHLLYKTTTVENLLRSLAGGYFHFNRVDSYRDFTGADLDDGRQLPADLPANASAKFDKAPDFSAADYYDQSRARTYACCFSLKNSALIWKNYADDSENGKVSIVYDFGKLRATLNQTLQDGNAALEYNGNRCRQIFSVNYGIVKYVARETHQSSSLYLPNPIEYTYLKDEVFSGEKEFRISLSALGLGQFVLNDGSLVAFPPSLHMAFDFRAAIADGTIQHMLRAERSDRAFLDAELKKLRIELKETSHPQFPSR